ncbi:MAG: hypothetical protein HOE55_02260 [Thiotrichales bacterium]|nr:hypothetical protein [Thiotrichales bacterium]MBT4151859.1 hypothetical protein [Thiotrichales bacterium]MBT4261992.1 hypothetical protein [Thiotrichales bacterium]MBT4573242.1 hypothetical protein [Thiotrichales bacterium]MBT5290833.1 hypothetical protein [Thiotrichales bacterium]
METDINSNSNPLLTLNSSGRAPTVCSCKGAQPVENISEDDSFSALLQDKMEPPLQRESGNREGEGRGSELPLSGKNEQLSSLEHPNSHEQLKDVDSETGDDLLPKEELSQELNSSELESKSEVQSPVTLEYSSAAKDEVVLDQFKVDSSQLGYEAGEISKQLSEIRDRVDGADLPFLSRMELHKKIIEQGEVATPPPPSLPASKEQLTDLQNRMLDGLPLDAVEQQRREQLNRDLQSGQVELQERILNGLPLDAVAQPQPQPLNGLPLDIAQPQLRGVDLQSIRSRPLEQVELEAEVDAEVELESEAELDLFVTRNLGRDKQSLDKQHNGNSPATTQQLGNQLATSQQLPLQTISERMQAGFTFDSALTNGNSSVASLNEVTPSTLTTAGLDPTTVSSRAETLKGMTVPPQQSKKWAAELGERVLVMSSKRLQSAEIRLNPPNLGILEVKLTISGDQAQLTFQSGHASVRDSLESSIPKIREMLEQQGLNLSDVNVGKRGQNSANDRGGSNGASRQQGLAGDDSVDDEVISISEMAVGRMGLVDYYV